MKAAAVASPGIVEVREVPMPEPGPDEVLIKVKAAGLNRADLLVAMGHFHGGRGGPGAIPGIECAGEVVRAGANVTSFNQGDRIMCSAASTFAFGTCITGNCDTRASIFPIGSMSAGLARR